MINFYDNFSSEDELESNFLRRGNNHHPHDQGQQRGRPWIDMEAEEHGNELFIDKCLFLKFWIVFLHTEDHF